MLKRTFSTFHPSNMLLQQQYREHNFKRYSKLISCLLVEEQNNELLLKTTSLARPPPRHSLKWIQPLLIIEEIMVKVVDVVKIINIEGDVLTIPKKKKKSHLTTRSGIIMKHNNKKREKVYWINLLKPMMNCVIGMAWKDIGHVHVVQPNI